MDQQSLPGTSPLKVTVPSKRRVSLALLIGERIALEAAAKEIESFQKQHPHVAGLGVALAVIQRRAAERSAEIGRIVLTVAAVAGMPIENHGISSGIEGEEIVLEALAPLPEAA